MAGKWELIGLDVIDMYDNVLKVKTIPKGLAMAFEEYDVDSRNWVVTSGTVNQIHLCYFRTSFPRLQRFCNPARQVFERCFHLEKAAVVVCLNDQ
ncbi:hypothetical protein ACW7EJ_02775, partial [Acinetobacter soli]